MQFIKKLLPNQLLKFIRPIYHGAVALMANLYFGRPSDKLIVIGVTGTNGKSTTVNLIAKILEEAGNKIGLTSTVNFKIAGEEKLNDIKMTMPSGWYLHKWMKRMALAGCKYAVLEISSEGLAQNRHLGINFDIAVFTNLTPEHLEAHGGFNAYKMAKAKLFAVLSKLQITNYKLQIYPKIQKTIVVNADDKHGEFYKNFNAQKHLSFGVSNPSADFIATNIIYSPEGVSYKLKAINYKLNLKGKFDIYNSLAAISAAEALGVDLNICKTALEKVANVAGRMEIIQEQPFKILVDYAPEPYSLQACYETIGEWPKNRLIHILGSCGGGRDRARRKILGQLAGKAANVVIVTNEDPYDDDPGEIINEVAAGAESTGKKLNQDLYKILDRREAIKKAILMARENDLVLITGKGAEQKMAVANGQYIDWDDRKVVREQLLSNRN
ncbi:MAG: UDP-N-acetylmuramoyl-L-alanyl-D-glutamate--2,6-diaminopimelate ligase [Candidatus Doudnabacteria bacterium]|nr:UDP-N-acetylmuramoyl-L-alanyl-D-glutamate--2,6-diaminopimelate ligase [Candidatus Doudnabacteria bacterium]